jgi:hypothetical protein
LGFWSQYSLYLTKRPDDGSLSKTTRPDTKTVGRNGMLKQRSSSNLNSTLASVAVTGDVRSTWLRSATKSFDVPLINLSSSYVSISS